MVRLIMANETNERECLIAQRFNLIETTFNDAQHLDKLNLRLSGDDLSELCSALAKTKKTTMVKKEGWSEEIYYVIVEQDC